MDHDIEELNRLAKALLEETKELEATVDRQGDGPLSAEHLPTVQRILGLACRHLTAVEAALAKPDGLLARLIERFDGGSASIPAADAARHFLDRHRDSLRSIGVSDEAIYSLISSLEENINDGTMRLDKPATLSSGDRQTIVDELRSLRELVCDIAANAELLAQVWDPTLAKAVRQGIIGACVIVVDVTGAILSAHITLPVLYGAAKSVWFGYDRVRSSVEKIRSRWGPLKSKVVARITEKKIKSSGPPSSPLKGQPRNK